MTTSLTNRIAACEPKRKRFLVVSLQTGAQMLACGGDSWVSVPFTWAKLYGYKAVSNAEPPTANTADVLVGFLDPTGESGIGIEEYVFVETLTKGGALELAAPPGTKYNLGDVCLSGETGDKVVVCYEQ